MAKNHKTCNFQNVFAIIRDLVEFVKLFPSINKQELKKNQTQKIIDGERGEKKNVFI